MKHPGTQLLLGAALLLTTRAAQAQASFSVGPQVGFIASSAHVSNQSPTIKYKGGFEAGVLGAIDFGHWGLQPALLFSQKGFEKTEVLGVDNTRLRYLTLPVNMVYHHKASGQGLQVVAGPYIGLLLEGTNHYRFTSIDPADPTPFPEFDYPIQVGDSAPYFKRFDAGLQAGIGYRFGGLLVQAAYSLGLRNTNLDTHYAYSASGYNRALQVSLAYLFGPKS